jgi:hypothetical protein
MKLTVSLYPRATVFPNRSAIIVDLRFGTIDFVEGTSQVSIWAKDYGRASESTADALRALVAQLSDAVEAAIRHAALAAEAPATPDMADGIPSAAGGSRMAGGV